MMLNKIWTVLLLIVSTSVFGQYHPTPNQTELSKLLEISDNAYVKAELDPYAKYVIVFYGDLDCNNFISEKVLNKSLFEKGIKFGYIKKEKCLSKDERYLSAEIYYLDNQDQLIGYFDGHNVLPTLTTRGEKMYSDTEDFIIYLSENKFSNIFNLGCALDISKYYATDEDGIPVIIDKSLFLANKNPIIRINDLN